MKDYSKYFKNVELSDIDSSYGFVTKLEVVGEEVHVWTPQTKKGEPHKYGIEKLPYFLNRLENQYQTIIDNQEIIKKDYMKKTKNIIFTIFIICVLPLIGIGASLILNELMIAGLALMLTSGIGGVLLTIYSCIKKEVKFEEKMAAYRTFIEKNRDIESLSKTDKNITENLSKKTNNDIKSREVLKENDTIDKIFNIDFMDKTSLKELKKLIENYNQSKSLFVPQEFTNPKEKKEESKTLALKK